MRVFVIGHRPLSSRDKALFQETQMPQARQVTERAFGSSENNAKPGQKRKRIRRGSVGRRQNLRRPMADRSPELATALMKALPDRPHPSSTLSLA
jgi:hypothetical protein